MVMPLVHRVRGKRRWTTTVGRCNYLEIFLSGYRSRLSGELLRTSSVQLKTVYHVIL